MIYPDAFNLTLLVEKIGIMIILIILTGSLSMNGHSLSILRCEMADNGYVQSILALGYTCQRQTKLWELLYTISHFSIKFSYQHGL